MGFVIVAATLGAATSCSDYADWNSVPVSQNPVADKTLWENIQSSEDLSDFAAIVSKVGMESVFTSDNYHTIWVPRNGTFDKDSLLALGDDKIMKEFVNNHMTNYNHLAAGVVNERVLTLNDKKYMFTNLDGAYTFNGVELDPDNMNIPNKNGTMHIIRTNVPYLPNAYQSIFEIQGADSMANYFKHHETQYLDESKSVLGPIVDGKQTYKDSVMVTTNRLTGIMNARFDNEDSLYTFIVPNNKAYLDAYDKYKGYYKYVANTKYQVFESVTSSNIKEETVPAMDVAYFQDSIARRVIAENLVFSHNNGYNMFMAKEDIPSNDTIVSTNRTRFSNAEEILDKSHVEKEIKLSNGRALLVDTLAFKSWEYGVPEINIRGSQRARYLNGESCRNVDLSLEEINPEVLTLDDDQRSFSYAWVKKSGEYVKTEIDFYLPNVLATTYHVYVVVPPAKTDLSYTEPEKAAWLNFSLYYYDGSKVQKKDFTNPAFVSGESIPGTTTKAKNIDFISDTTKVDTIDLGEFKFPYSYKGLEAKPNLRISVASGYSVFNKTHTALYDQDIRIANIILRPVEYDEYLKKEGEGMKEEE